MRRETKGEGGEEAQITFLPPHPAFSLFLPLPSFLSLPTFPSSPLPTFLYPSLVFLDALLLCHSFIHQSPDGASICAMCGRVLCAQSIRCESSWKNLRDHVLTPIRRGETESQGGTRKCPKSLRKCPHLCPDPAVLFPPVLTQWLQMSVT